MKVVPFSPRRELGRKALHLLSVIVPLAYASGVSHRVIVVVLITACGIAVAVELARLLHDRSRVVFRQMTAGLLRGHEHADLAGATWLVVAFLGAVLVFPPTVAIAAMWAVAVGDAAAAIVGRNFGRHHLWRSAKSFEGSTACFVGTITGTLLVAKLARGEAILAALIATAAEWPDRPFDDNIRIAAAVGGGILLWRIAFS